MKIITLEIEPQKIYDKWQKKLPDYFGKIKPSNDLLSVVGTGEKVVAREEKKKISQYLGSNE